MKLKAIILSSKRITITGDINAASSQINAWLQSMNQKLDGCLLVVTLKSLGICKQKKATAVEELNTLAKKEASSWEHRVHTVSKTGSTETYYKFDFENKHYFWNGEDIYLTANEQLFLYRWLVLNDGTHELQWYFLRNMRRRLGKEFLSDVMEGKNDNS